jgi:hypothetical protein
MSTYEIVVQGRVRGALSRALEGFDVVAGDSAATCFRGRVADQAELHSVLRRISSCNLRLTSVQRVDETFDDDAHADGPGG